MNYKKYHPDWRDVIRPAILKRDNYKCRHCHVQHKALVYRKSDGTYHECDEFEYNWAKANQKKPFQLFLQVAHMDHDKGNNNHDNLMSLCPRCHGKFDKAHKMMQRKILQTDLQKRKSASTDYETLEKRRYATRLSNIIHSCTGVRLSKELSIELFNKLKQVQ